MPDQCPYVSTGARAQRITDEMIGAEWVLLPNAKSFLI